MYKVGELVHNRYLIEKVLGRGGMAVVFKARDTINNVSIAIKLINEEIVKKNLVQNYHIEKSANEILGENNHIIRLYDEFQNGDEWAIVLECIEGGSLTEYINFFSCLTKKELQDYFIKLAGALHHAHKLKIVHRDIKTDNILFSKYHQIKLGDFGIALTEESDDKEKTKRIGTPSYMPPEQIMQIGYDEISDIYSLGCTLYYAAIGELPFISSFSDLKKRNNDLLKKQCRLAPVRPSLLNLDLDYQWDEIILKMLEKDPKRRYQSMSQVVEALKSIDNDKKVCKEYNYAKKYVGKKNVKRKVLNIYDANNKLAFYQTNKFIYCLVAFLIGFISIFFILLVLNV